MWLCRRTTMTTVVCSMPRAAITPGGQKIGREIFKNQPAVPPPAPTTQKSGCVAYLRVSTGGQGKSGLGLEAQRESITRFAAAEGLTILAEFVEVETGKGSDALERRPKLREA